MLLKCLEAHVRSYRLSRLASGLLSPIPSYSLYRDSIAMSSSNSSESELHELGDKQTSSSIWTTTELKILQSYIDAYKQEPVNNKQKLVQKQVVPKIKAAYGDRYKESSLRANKEINEEWKKKKRVSPNDLEWSTEL